MSTIEARNKAHYEALAVVEAAVAAGIKIKRDNVKGDVWEPKNRKKSIAHVNKKIMAMSSVERFKFLIKKHKRLTRSEMCSYSALNTSEVSRVSTLLVKEGFIKKRVDGNAGAGKSVTYVHKGEKRGLGKMERCGFK